MSKKVTQFKHLRVSHLVLLPIAANLGDEESMKALWVAFKGGQINKEDLEATLRTHQAAIVATKSSQRVAAERAFGHNR